MSGEEFSISNILKEDERIQDNPDLLEKILAVFDFTQYILDDDENLTKSANLNGNARTLLDKRIEELFLGDSD
jgi:hypothetical protein